MNSPNRSQPDPNPRSIDELIPEGHEARVVWDMVQQLDMTELHERIKAVEGHPGRTPIDPQILVALWLFATIEGIASARQLAKLCYRDDAFKWLRGGVDVNYHTLSDFRTVHGKWLEQQVVLTIAVLRSEGLVDLKQVGQDGLRVRASAGAGSFRREDKLEAYLQEAQQQWDQLEAELAANEQLSPRQRAARKRARRERLERLQRAKQELPRVQAAREARKKGDGAGARVSMTDPEARVMKMPDGGFRPAYNVQFATDLNGLVVIGVDVIDVGGDGGQMDPMVERIEEQQGKTPEEYFTDGGFSTKEDIQNVSDRGVTVYTPVKEAERQQSEGKDPYAPRRGESPELGAWRQRMGTPEGQEQYRQRSKCEWSNATVRNWGLYEFLVRGLEKVKAVALWYALALNVMRTVALRAARELAIAG